MTQEDKELLLQDLCSRLPYGVILNCCDSIGEKLIAIDENGLINYDYDIEEVKPYLFPLSSMTEEQYDEYTDMGYSVTERGWSMANYHQINWFNKNHLDYRGLIKKGFAIDATGLNIY